MSNYTEGVTAGASLIDTSMTNSQNDLFSQKSSTFSQKGQTQNLDRQSLSTGAQTLSENS